MSYGAHGTTFGGGPLACAIGSRVVDLISKKKLLNGVIKKEGIFIPPTMYDAARSAGGPMRQVDALKYMIGAYKDGELVKQDAL